VANAYYSIHLPESLQHIGTKIFDATAGKSDWRAVANFELDDSDSGIYEKCLSLCAFFGYRHEVNKTFKCDKHTVTMVTKQFAL